MFGKYEMLSFKQVTSFYFHSTFCFCFFFFNEDKFNNESFTKFQSYVDVDDIIIRLAQL